MELFPNRLNVRVLYTLIAKTLRLIAITARSQISCRSFKVVATMYVLQIWIYHGQDILIEQFSRGGVLKEDAPTTLGQILQIYSTDTMWDKE
jgi:hypothetical protein